MRMSKVTAKAGLSQDRRPARGLPGGCSSSTPLRNRWYDRRRRRSLRAGGGSCCDRLLKTPSRYSMRGVSAVSVLVDRCSTMRVLLSLFFAPGRRRFHFIRGRAPQFRRQHPLGPIQARSNGSFRALQNSGGLLITLFLQAAQDDCLAIRMRQIEDRARKQLQVRLRRKQGFGILHSILTAKLIQKSLPFRRFKNTLQRSKPIGFATFLPGKIPCDSEKIPFQGPLPGVKLSHRPGAYLFKNRHKYSLGEIFSEGNRPRHMHQKPIHGTPVAIIKLQKSGLISLLQALDELSLGISVVLRGLFPVASSRPQQ